MQRGNTSADMIFQSTRGKKTGINAPINDSFFVGDVAGKTRGDEEADFVSFD